MKIRAVVKALILSIFVASLSFSANAASNSQASSQRSFSSTFKSASNPKVKTKNTVVDTFETETGTVSTVVPKVASQSSESFNAAGNVVEDDDSWGVFGLTPKPWMKDRSMFPNPNGCTIIDGTPCTKPCGSKCMKPCDGASCKKEPECVPCKKVIAPVIPYEPEPCANYLTIMEDEIYRDIHFKCGNFAPVDFQWVDFRLQKGRKYGSYSDRMGNYRFRIFGCRRDAKEVLLNKGRTLEKDMHFINIFEDIVNGCVPLTKIPDDLCVNPNQPLPEYVMTAEITNFFMNVCDEYDWNTAKKENKRNGSAEITVTWRIMDLTKTNTLWKGTTTGYSDVDPGTYNGELMLVERAFADAVDNLRQQPGFVRQLSTRVDPRELARQRQLLIEMQYKNTPEKCPYIEHVPLQSGQPCDCSRCPKSSCGEDETIHVEVEKYVEEEPIYVTETRTITPPMIVENSGSTSYGTTIIDEITKEKPYIEESSDFIIETTEVEESSNVIVKTSEVDEYASLLDKNVLCIKDREPYEMLGTEEMKEIRSTLVTVKDNRGFKAAGILLSEQYVLTSANLVNRKDNSLEVSLVNGDKINAKAFRINPSKNTALLLLDKEVKYTPLSISLDLPVIDEGTYRTVALKDINEEDKIYMSSLDYLFNEGKVTGYRYSDNIGVEIMTDTDTQKTTIGGTLINPKGTVYGIANSAPSFPEDNDLFMPTETALQSLGLEVCEREFTPKRPKYTPISDAIETNVGPKDPGVLDKKERK